MGQQIINRDNQKTTYIRIKVTQKQILDKLKIIENEPYYSVVDRILKFVMMKPKEFVESLDLPSWVYEKVKELKAMQEAEEKKKNRG